MTEERAGSAKSVFHFDVQGSVAKSTHAGIPWLRSIRERPGKHVHFWPFDGWDILAGRSAIVEVYPTLWSRSFANEGGEPATNTTPSDIASGSFPYAPRSAQAIADEIDVDVLVGRPMALEIVEKLLLVGREMVKLKVPPAGTRRLRLAHHPPQYGKCCLLASVEFFFKSAITVASYAKSP